MKIFGREFSDFGEGNGPEFTPEDASHCMNLCRSRKVGEIITKSRGGLNGRKVCGIQKRKNQCSEFGQSDFPSGDKRKEWW